jgi:hypothetical protein
MKTLLVCAAGLLVACAGCNSPDPRLNAPPHGQPETTSEIQSTFVHMVDNGLLADMTVSDIHFLPHRPLLNPLGEQRLSRLALLMEAYGGEVRFSSDVADEDLVAQRTEAIRDFLCKAGIDTSSEVVRADLPGGRGMEATEVILIKAEEGTYKAKKSQSSSSSLTQDAPSAAKGAGGK